MSKEGDGEPELASFTRADEFLAGVEKLTDLDLHSSPDDATDRCEQREVDQLCQLVRKGTRTASRSAQADHPNCPSSSTSTRSNRTCSTALSNRWYRRSSSHCAALYRQIALP